jgi:hypothetical protein
MLKPTRRGALTLLLAALGGTSFPPMIPRVFAQENEEGEQGGEKEECYNTEKFGAWFGRATEKHAGARNNDVPFENAKASPLSAEIHVSEHYDAKLVLYGDTDKIKFTKEFLINPENRLIGRDETGKERVNAPLCGNCNDIEDDKFSVVLPLATAPLLRSNPSIGIAFKFAGHEEYGFKLELRQMRRALMWARKRRDALAERAAEGKCTPIGDFE